MDAITYFEIVIFILYHIWALTMHIAVYSIILQLSTILHFQLPSSVTSARGLKQRHEYEIDTSKKHLKYLPENIQGIA